MFKILLDLVIAKDSDLILISKEEDWSDFTKLIEFDFNFI